MATLAIFYGIIVVMHSEQGSPHHKPHIHARCSNSEVSIALDGEVLAGSLPKRKMSLLVAWMEIHRAELEDNWLLLTAGAKPFKIDPLR